MIEIFKCSEVDDQLVYEAFLKGYSDYIIKIEMSFEMFVSRFLTRENKREYSLIALDQGNPIALMLGGIEVYEKIKTLRCGGFATAPSYRGRGIGKKLFEFHKRIAQNEKCRLIYLEVLKDNLEAIRLYRYLGYHAVHDYRLYHAQNISLRKRHSLVVREVPHSFIANIRESIEGLHIHWQGEMSMLKKYDDIINLSFYEDNELVGVLSIRPSGSICFIWVRPELRLKGYGESILAYGEERMEENNLVTVACNNISYEGFINRLGFKIHLEQFEMMKVLP